MLRKLLLSSCVVGVLFSVPVRDAHAHGGTYHGPPDIQGPPDPVGPTTPGTGDPPPVTPPGGHPPITPGSGPPSTGGPNSGPPGGPPGGGNKGPRTGPGTQKRAHNDSDYESWQIWWLFNKDRFVNVRERLGEGAASGTGTGGFLIGQGTKASAAQATRPSSEEITKNIVPLLRSLLTENDADIVDSAALSLGRIVPSDSSALCFTDLVATLGSRYNSVQESTLLSLGVLGSKDAVPILIEVMNDTAKGRQALKVNGGIQNMQRSFAALALGYIGSPDTIPVLRDAITKCSPADKSLRASALVALGLFESGREDIIPFLIDQLRDEKMDEDCAGQIPISLARLGGESALPSLRKIALARGTPARVEESAIIALGMLGSVADKDVVDALVEKIRDGQNGQARHFAIIALADIAERALADGSCDPDMRATAVARISKSLLAELNKAKQKDHEPWAGLALAIVARAYGEHSRSGVEIRSQLEDKFASESNPNYQPAYALALGIADDQVAAASILAKLEKTTERGAKGFYAVALGLLRANDARETLHVALKDDADPTYRLQVATALGLLADVDATNLLIEQMHSSKTLSLISPVARAIGLIGDGRAVRPLTSLVSDDNASGMARGFGCVALGLLAEKTDLPWNARLSIHLNYRTQIPALREVLDIL